MGEKQYKRRKLLIDPVFQYRFVKKVTIMALMVVISSSVGVMFILSWVKRKVSQPDPFSDHSSVSLESLPDVSWMFSHLWPYFLLGLVVVTIISILFGVMMSFRIAGPEYRMRKILQAMAAGDFSEKVGVLRSHDELENIYVGINNMHAQWKNNVQTMQNICNEDTDSDKQLAKLKEMIFSFRTEEAH